MKKKYKTVLESEVLMTSLMLPSYANFGGKIHGGYILGLLDQIAFACACKHSGHYCITASVDIVDFLAPVDVGDLLTMKASVNYVGNTSMVVGIRVEAENVKTGELKHCNSSYFTMVAKGDGGEKVEVPGLILKTKIDIDRFVNASKMLEMNRSRVQYKVDLTNNQYKKDLEGFRVKLEL